MVKTKKSPTAFRGVWRIVEAGLWETEPFGPHAAPEIAFEEDETGTLQIATIHADLDCRYAGSRVEFSFEGEDEEEAVAGRGFAEIVKPGRLQGHRYSTSAPSPPSRQSALRGSSRFGNRGPTDMPSERLRDARNLPDSPAPARDELRAHLERLSKDDLIDLLLERSLHDATLACELGVRAVADTRDGRIDVPAMKREIARTTDSHGYVDWRAVGMYADGVEDVVDALERYAAGGDDRASDVAELAEYALVRLDDAMGHVQDDGDLEPAIKRLHTLHLAACVRSNPDPIALARRLFEHELTSGFGFFHRAEEVYAEVLGAAGSSEYRRLAEAEWAKIPALGPGWREPPGIPNRHKIAAIVERLARATGDVEAVVAILVRDLSAPHCYLRIAHEYARVGTVAKARLWIEKGIKAFRRNPDARLHAFLERLDGANGRAT